MSNLSARKKILLIDDDEMHLFATEGMLKNEYDITSSKSGKEALELLSLGYIPDLILLDVLMPDMDGWEAYNRIKGLTSLHKAPIAFVTSIQGEAEEKHAQSIGAVDFIPKPFNRNEIKSRIEMLLKKYE